MCVIDHEGIVLLSACLGTVDCNIFFVILVCFMRIHIFLFLSVLFPGGHGQSCDMLSEGYRNIQGQAEVGCVGSRRMEEYFLVSSPSYGNLIYVV